MKNVMLTPFFSPTPPKPLVEKKNEGNKRLLMRYTGDSNWLRITWFAFIYVYSVGTMVTGNRINNRSAAKKKVLHILRQFTKFCHDIQFFSIALFI